jgi:hypothetical protein
VSETEAVEMVDALFGRCEMVEQPGAVFGVRMSEPNANGQWVHADRDLDELESP